MESSYGSTNGGGGGPLADRHYPNLLPCRVVLRSATKLTNPPVRLPHDAASAAASAAQRGRSASNGGGKNSNNNGGAVPSTYDFALGTLALGWALFFVSPFPTSLAGFYFRIALSPHRCGVLCYSPFRSYQKSKYWSGRTKATTTGEEEEGAAADRNGNSWRR